MNGAHEIFLETAHCLGAKLCRDAIWAGNRCNWVGPAAIEISPGLRATAHSACGADLYSGTTGIAAFLIRLYASTGERVFALTAEGALRQALSRLDDLPAATSSGYYVGLTGIAATLIDLAEALDKAKFAAMALLILEDIAKEDISEQGLVVIDGSAGTIPALLKIYRKRPQDFLLELAIKHGECLLAAAEARNSTLCASGFAQGRDGIAWALLELYRATQRDDFRRAAERVFHAGNASPDSGGSNPATWFAGSSGIGMTRLRAFEILGDTLYLDQARAAIRKVTESLCALSAENVDKDFSLAHGSAGAAELLLHAAHVLEDESHGAAAEQVGLYGIEHYRRNNLPWPCGAPGGLETQNLMFGIAGVGYFYLRLHNLLQTPSVLLVLPTPDALEKT